MQNIYKYYVLPQLAGQVVRRGRNTCGQPGILARTHKHITKPNWLRKRSFTGELYLHRCVALHCTLHWTRFINKLEFFEPAIRLNYYNVELSKMWNAGSKNPITQSNYYRTWWDSSLISCHCSWFSVLTSGCWLVRLRFYPRPSPLLGTR